MVHSVSERPSLYQTITERIVAAIAAGADQFVMPWHRPDAPLGRPINALTRRPYQGGNVVILWAEAMLSGFASGHWASYRQWQQLGAQVRKGEHGAAILFYKPIEQERDPADPTHRFVVRGSHVFNAGQVEGWEPEAPDPKAAPAIVLPRIETFVARTGASVRYGKAGAWYDPLCDEVILPPRHCFRATATRSATEALYAVLLHELVHWSGATHRLDRQFGKRFGDAAYAAEELVAELGAAFLCADLAITNEPRADHAAYIGHWLKILDQDTRAIFTAARLASDAAAYLCGLALDPP